jgi:hypothetical protein
LELAGNPHDDAGEEDAAPLAAHDVAQLAGRRSLDRLRERARLHRRRIGLGSGHRCSLLSGRAQRIRT